MTQDDRAVVFDERLKKLEHSHEKFLDAVIHSGVVDEKLANMQNIVNKMQDEVSSLRRAMIGFALSISLSAIVFAFAVFELLGNGAVK